MNVDSAEHCPNCNHSAALHRQRGWPMTAASVRKPLSLFTILSEGQRLKGRKGEPCFFCADGRMAIFR